MFWAVRKEDVASPFSSPQIFQASIAVRLLQKNYIKFSNMKPLERFSSFDRFVEASCIKRNSIYGHIPTRLMNFFLTQFMNHSFRRSIAFSLAMKIVVQMIRWLQFTIGWVRRIQITMSTKKVWQLTLNIKQTLIKLRSSLLYRRE